MKSKHALYSYETGQYVRPATSKEAEASDLAALKDGGRGVIVIDGKNYYTLWD